MQADTTAAPAVPAPPPGAAPTSPGVPSGSDGTEVEHLAPEKAPEPVPPPAAKDPARPEWLLDKYKTVEDQAKAYVEAEKLIGKKSAAPDTYELKVPEGFDGESFPEEDVEFFRGIGLNNDQAQAVADMIYTDLAPQLREMQTENEMSLLRANWKTDENATMQRMQSVKQWADQNLPPAAVKAMSATGGGVQAMWDMMQSGARGMVQPQQAASVLSRAQLQDMVADPRFRTDEGYRREVESKFASAFDK